MKNTQIPLDIGYFSKNGKLRELHHGRPFDLTGLVSKSDSLQFVVELGAGEFSRLGIKLGDRINLKMVANAIISSGEIQPITTQKLLIDNPAGFSFASSMNRPASPLALREVSRKQLFRQRRICQSFHHISKC